MNFLKKLIGPLAIFSLAVLGGYLLVTNTQLEKKLESLSDQITSLTSDFKQASVKLEGLNNSVETLALELITKKPPAAGDSSDQAVTGNTFYIDPINGSANGDGSKENPWGNLQEVIDSGFIESRNWSQYPAGELNESFLQPRNQGAQIKSGDTIYLMSGNYGDLKIQGYYNTNPIDIKAYPGQNPVFKSIYMRSVANWNFDNITIDRTGLVPVKYLFNVLSHSHLGNSWNINISNSHITGSNDINSWGLTEWLNTSGGITLNARNSIVRNNLIENVKMALMSNGDNSLIEYNTINQFAFDGIHPFGNYTTVQYNLIKNSVYTDYRKNHDDAIQSWNYSDEPLKGVIIHGNVIIDNFDLNKSRSKFLATRTPGMQGIGLFDGPMWDWQITNNIIVVSSHHGISAYTFKNGLISDNIIIQNPLRTDKTPWIKISVKDQFNMWPVENNVVSHNIVSGTISSINESKNTIQPNYIASGLTTDIFKDYEGENFELNDNFQNTINKYFGEYEKTINNLNDFTNSIPIGTSTEEVIEEPVRQTHDIEIREARTPESDRETSDREIRQSR